MGPSREREISSPPITFWISVKKDMMDIKIWDDSNKAKLKGLVSYIEALGCRFILHAKNTGS